MQEFSIYAVSISDLNKYNWVKKLVFTVADNLKFV